MDMMLTGWLAPEAAWRRELAGHGRAVLPAAVVAAAWALWVFPGPAVGGALVVATAGAALGVIDARTHRLPDALTLPAIWLALVTFGAAAFLPHGGGAARLAQAGWGALTLGGLYAALYWLSRGALGFGDVKLALLLGLPAGWCGWSAVWGTALLPFLLGGLAALGLVVARVARLDSQLAFGPFMLIGAALTCGLSRVGR